MIRTRLNRSVTWGTVVLCGIVAAGLAWCLRPAEERVFVVDATWSLLMRAARAGDVATVRDLLASGSDPNVRGGSQGLTPLMFAATPAMAKLLLQNGADACLRSSDGKSAADHVQGIGQPELAAVMRLAERRSAVLNTVERCVSASLEK